MKKLVVLTGFMALMSLISIKGIIAPELYAPSDEDPVHVLVSPELSALVSKWIDEYSATGSEIIVNQSGINDERSEYSLRDKGVIGIVTEDYLHSLHRESLWSMVVARDVIVPVISSSNPFSEKVRTNGLSPGQFAGVYTESGILTWGKVLNIEDNTTVNCYCIGDESLKYCLAEFLQADNLKDNVVKASDNDELIRYIINDNYSIGFCRLSAIIDYENHSIIEGLQIVPVDINGNGILEHNENIYRCLNDFNRGIWIGKYPGSLCRNIHVVSTKAPIAVTETDFVQWILSGGQAYISDAGYSELIPGERQPKIQALNERETTVIDSKDQPIKAATILFIAGTVLFIGLIVFVTSRFLKVRVREAYEVPGGEFHTLTDNNLRAPKGLYFDKTHTWAFMEKDGQVRVGIDDFLQHIAGKITGIKMKESGIRIQKGEPLISLVQNGKRLDIYSPVSGIITEANKDLTVNSSVINSSPYNDGWVYAVKPDSWMKEVKRYLIGDNYREWLRAEFSRLKDFVAENSDNEDLSGSKIIMQDGGEIRDGLLENFGPDMWEEFQRGFINTAI